MQPIGANGMENRLSSAYPTEYQQNALSRNFVERGTEKTQGGSVPKAADGSHLRNGGARAGGTPSSEKGQESALLGRKFDRNECQTCKRRRYQDGSDDPGVSFKTPQHISPDAAPSAVRAHEMEHVYREQASAQREQREVVSQSVTIHTGICPECGRVYVSGGTTRTVTRDKSDEVEEVLQNMAKDEEE